MFVEDLIFMLIVVVGLFMHDERGIGMILTSKCLDNKKEKKNIGSHEIHRVSLT